MRVRTYRDLIVWQKAFALCVEVYERTRAFPKEERYGLTSEARKTARSIMCNIAEGHRRQSTTEYARFLDIAYGSAAELETQLLLASALSLDCGPLLTHLAEVDRMLAALLLKIRSRARHPTPAR